jgi:hypothetical protein
MVFVMVTELFNAHFENGFRILLPNKDRAAMANGNSVLANEWYPFENSIQVQAGNKDVAVTGTVNNGNLQVIYNAEEFINRDGERSQAIKVQGSGMAGIRQTVCANPGWDYEFTAYYHLPATGNDSVFIIGIDDMGGTDPSNAAIQWVMAAASEVWVHASVRVCAKAEKITCFTGVLQARGNSILYIDKAALFMIQPKYGHVPDTRKQVDNCCPVDEIESHDFSRLTTYSRMPQLNTATLPKYTGGDMGVKFLTSETAAGKPLMLLPAATSGKMSDILVKGAAKITGAIVKNVVTGTIETVLPFLKRKK